MAVIPAIRAAAQSASPEIGALPAASQTVQAIGHNNGRLDIFTATFQNMQSCIDDAMRNYLPKHPEDAVQCVSPTEQKIIPGPKSILRNYKNLNGPSL
jgi:hypothetical protein